MPNCLLEQQLSFQLALHNTPSDLFLQQFEGNIDRAREGFEIYRLNILAALRHAILTTYPVIETLIGRSALGALAQIYANNHPSGSGDLNQYGCYFSDFLAQHPISKDLPYLPDMACLEWAIQVACLSAEPVLGDLESPQQQSEEELLNALLLHWPGATLLKSSFPVDEIWHAHQLGKVEERDKALEKVNLIRGHYPILVLHHPQLSVCVMRKSFHSNRFK